MSVVVVIKFILFGIILISAILSFIKRSENKSNLKHAIQENNSTRELTQDELQLIQPYLTDKKLIKSHKLQTALVSNEVSVIAGACVRHSTRLNGTETSYYYMIDDIEVILPYNMENYTMDDNAAEVVFTKKYAIVVNLNGVTLQIAKAEIDAQKNLAEQWAQGARGQYTAISDEELQKMQEEDDSPETLAFVNQINNMRCEILEQRDETQQESARRNQLSLGIFPAWSLILAAVFTYFYSGEIILLILASVSLLLAILTYFKKRRLKVEKINHLRGTVTKHTESRHLFIGDSLSVIYPKHWNTVLPEKSASTVDMDVSVTNRELIRYGHALSIAKEIEKYGAPKFWGRNCFLLIVGLVLSIILALMAVSSIKNDFLFSYQWITGKTNTFSIDSLTDLRTADLHIGDRLNLNVPGASCDANNFIACNHIVINELNQNIPGFLKETSTWVNQLASTSYYQNIMQKQITYLTQLQSQPSSVNILIESENDYSELQLLIKGQLVSRPHYNMARQIVYNNSVILGQASIYQKNGFITQLIKTDDGFNKTIAINVDYANDLPLSELNSDNFMVPEVVIKSTMLLLMVLFALSQFLVLSIKIVKNRARQKRIAEEYQTIYLV